MDILHFNELSSIPPCADEETADRIALALAETLKAARKEGFRIIRCDDGHISGINLAEGYSLNDFCLKNLRGTPNMLIMSMFHPPYYEPDSEMEKRYIESVFSVEVPEDIHPDRVMKAIGLPAAAMHDSICVSLATHEFWETNKLLNVKEEKDGESLRSYKVYNFSKPTDFVKTDHYLRWCLDHRPANFLDCGIEPEKKTCSLSSDHHGNDELKRFAKDSLFILPYIVGVVTSISYSPQVNRFVKSIQYNVNGDSPTRLEVVLHWTEQGYGMVVETTARDEFELHQIANELEKKFGPRRR